MEEYREDRDSRQVRKNYVLNSDFVIGLAEEYSFEPTGTYIYMYGVWWDYIQVRHFKNNVYVRFNRVEGHTLFWFNFRKPDRYMLWCKVNRLYAEEGKWFE